MGRILSTLQRFTSDDFKFAIVSFYSHNLQISSYRADLQKITSEQFSPVATDKYNPSIKPVDIDSVQWINNKQRFTWGIGPYVTHRLFNPDLPLSMETGIEEAAGYRIASASVFRYCAQISFNKSY